MSRKLLPLVVDIPEPCEAKWEDMRGDGRRRLCDHCEKTVVNLTALTRDEIEAILRSGACVSFEYRANATVVTAEEPLSSARRPSIAAGVVLAATLAAALACDSIPIGRTSGSPVEPPASSTAAPRGTPIVPTPSTAAVTPANPPAANLTPAPKPPKVTRSPRGSARPPVQTPPRLAGKPAFKPDLTG